MSKKLIFILYLIIFTVNIQAQEISKQNKTDSVNFNELSLANSSINSFEQKYLLETELEHQKLLRNIFMISFAFLFIVLMFIILYYGSKVKKINDLIVMQNDRINAVRDQLQKIISVFDHIDRMVFITDTKGIIEWANINAREKFTEDFLRTKISLIEKFTDESQGKIFKAINKSEMINFDDQLFENVKNWKMVPISNSNNEFANMVFIGLNL